MIEARAYEAMSQPLTGIRDPYFLAVIAEVQAGLREALGTTNTKTFLVPGSGSGAVIAQSLGGLLGQVERSVTGVNAILMGEYRF